MRLSGARAEALARRHALLRGAVLLEANARLPGGELDLVLRHWPPPHWGTYVFAEVKGRRSGERLALAAVDPRKQARIVRAAHEWLLRRGLEPGEVRVRFDAFAVVPDARGRWRVTWIQDAFEAA